MYVSPIGDLSSAAGPAAEGEGNAEDGTAQEAAKRLRNLQKKLRQIQQLKDKQASGAALVPEQVQKIASEAALLQEMASLNVK